MFNSEECEVLGAIIGDGFIYTKHKKYVIGLTGHKQNDSEYFSYLKKLMTKNWRKEPKLFFRHNSVRLTLSSKETVLKILKICDFAFGAGKCARARIPKSILKDIKLCKCFVRGIVDTDGSIFTANKPGTPNYPSIEFTTTSKELAIQVRGFLLAIGFKPANIWSYKSKTSKLRAYKVPLNGVKNLGKWVKEIGFSNPYKLNRALIALS